MKLQLPSLKKAGDKKEAKPGAKSGADKFISDLYRDLSDRHLLLPLIGLLIAIVAVPMLLSSSPEPAVPTTASPIKGGDATALDAAVVVSNPGIRDYRERLAALKAKNPFQAIGGGGSSGGNEGTATTTTSGDGAAADPTTPSGSSTGTTPSTGSTSSGSIPIDTGTDTSSGTTPPPVDTPTDPGTDTTPEDVKPETRFYASRIDVTIGPVGKAKTVEGVKQLDFLPDKQTPVVAYLGLVNETQALFSVNPGVAETQGEGDCAPRKNACMYVSLKVGEEQRFVYGDAEDAKIYRLKLLDARTVRVPDPSDREPQDTGEKARTHAPVDASSRTN